MIEEENPNVIGLTQLNEEEQEMIIARDTIYGMIERPCPWCSCMTLQEDTYGYEKVVYCTHCEYSQSKTI